MGNHGHARVAASSDALAKPEIRGPALVGIATTPVVAVMGDTALVPVAFGKQRAAIGRERPDRARSARGAGTEQANHEQEGESHAIAPQDG